MRRAPRFGIFGLLAGFAVLAALLPLAATVPSILSASRTESDQRSADALNTAARQVAVRLSRGLAEQWREHTALSRIATAEGIGGTFALRLDTAKLLNSRLAWIGVAAPDGRVLAASDRVLEGQDVSARPWFRAGLQGAFAGDVHEALLLARLLPAPASGEPLRLIDFAVPLRRSDGTVLGVLGSHVDWAWVRDLVRNAPALARSEVLLIARDGTVLVGPSGLEGQPLRLRVALSAQQGVAATGIETWGDGGSYHTVAVPIGAGDGTPGFGWSIVIRQDPATTLGTARQLAVSLATPLAIAAALVLVAGLLVARALSRTAGRLAAAAGAMADGRLDYPVPETRATRELAQLAEALARLDRAPLDKARRTKAMREEAL